MFAAVSSYININEFISLALHFKQCLRALFQTKLGLLNTQQQQILVTLYGYTEYEEFFPFQTGLT